MIRQTSLALLSRSTAGVRTNIIRQQGYNSTLKQAFSIIFMKLGMILTRLHKGSVICPEANLFAFGLPPAKLGGKMAG